MLYCTGAASYIEISLKKGGRPIEIIVYHPETPEKQAELEKSVAKFHAQYVLQYLEKLNCPTEQKLTLADAIAKTILDGEKTEAGI